ncbi:unnamed protein product [Sphacelaria rigidula]
MLSQLACGRKSSMRTDFFLICHLRSRKTLLILNPKLPIAQRLHLDTKAGDWTAVSCVKASAQVRPPTDVFIIPPGYSLFYILCRFLVVGVPIPTHNCGRGRSS